MKVRFAVGMQADGNNCEVVRKLSSASLSLCAAQKLAMAFAEHEKLQSAPGKKNISDGEAALLLTAAKASRELSALEAKGGTDIAHIKARLRVSAQSSVRACKGMSRGGPGGG